MDDISVFD